MSIVEGHCEIALPSGVDFSFGDSDNFIFAPFNVNGSVVDFSPTSSGMLSDEISFQEPVVTKQEYIDLIARAKEAFSSEQDFTKVVLARNKVIERPDDFDPETFYRKVRDQYPTTFSYMVSSRETGTWIGASPELLVSVKGNEISSVALAGTLTSDEHQWGPKEIEEQQIVARYVNEVFARNGVDDIRSTEAKTVRAGTIRHLRSEVHGKVDPKLIRKIIDSLHPTPAVAGYPKEKGIEFIRAHEKLNRKFYSGYFGLQNSDQTLLHVNLRCMKVHKDKLEFFAGAGITKDSDPEKEWHETERKIDTLLRLI